MTIQTMPWTSNNIGDGPSVGHGVEISRRMFRLLHNLDPAEQGVVPAALNELALSHSTASEIDVDTGAAQIYGTFLHSDAVETLTLAGVAADTAGIVTVGMGWTGGITGTAQTGFIRAIQQASGNPAFPVVTQTDLTVWEIEIGRYIVDSGGNVYTDTGKGTAGVLDTRKYLGQTDKTYFIPCNGADDDGGGTLTQPSVDGWYLPAGANNAAYGQGQVPSDFIRFTSLKAVFLVFNSPGNVYGNNVAKTAACGSAPVSNQTGATAVTFSSDVVACDFDIGAIDMFPNDTMGLQFFRNGVHANDTLSGTIFFRGWELAYEGHNY